MGDVTVLVGGARSGKSTLAVELGRRASGSVIVIVTAEPTDADMATRIARHREERPPWPTIEAPIALGDAIGRADHAALLIVDCVTVWLGNEFARAAPDRPPWSIYRDMNDALHARPGPSVVVTNEVGMGIHPDTELARAYRDELGRVNQLLASTAATTLLVVAGRAVRLDDPLQLLGHSG